MTETTTTPIAATAPGFFGMAWGVLARPRPTFRTLRDHPRRTWIFMALLGMILVTLPIIAGGPVAAQQTRALVQEQFENQPSFADNGIDAEQAASFATSPIITTVVPGVLTIFGLAIGWLIWSGSLYMLASMIGGRSNYLQMLQVVVWAWLPYALRNIVQTVYITATQTLIEHPGLSGFAPAPLVEEALITPPSTGTAVLQIFLGQIDIYLFWNLALLVLGISAVAQLTRRKSIGLVLIIWTAFMAVRLIFTAVSTNLASGFIGG